MPLVDETAAFVRGAPEKAGSTTNDAWWDDALCNLECEQTIEQERGACMERAVNLILPMQQAPFSQAALANRGVVEGTSAKGASN